MEYSKLQYAYVQCWPFEMKSVFSYSFLLIITGLLSNNEAFTPLHLNDKTRWVERAQWLQHTSTLSLSTRSTSRQTKTEVPAGVEVLSRDPLIYIIPNLLSPDQCRAYQSYIGELELQNRTMTRSNPPEVSLNYQKLWPLPLLSLLAAVPQLFKIDREATLSEVQSAVVPPILLALGTMLGLAFLALPFIRIVSDSAARTSDAMALNLKEDAEIVQELVQRVQESTGHLWDCWEAPVVTRYDPGTVFSRHGDASPTRGSEWEDLGGQRIVTCICYLNDVENGGETFFDKLGYAVTPKQGRGLVFFPANSDSLEADDRTTHESLPPATEKWIVQMFGRVRRVPPPLGLPYGFFLKNEFKK
jgi:hypothetical protein